MLISSAEGATYLFASDASRSAGKAYFSAASRCSTSFMNIFKGVQLAMNSFLACSCFSRNRLPMTSLWLSQQRRQLLYCNDWDTCDIQQYMKLSTICYLSPVCPMISSFLEAELQNNASRHYQRVIVVKAF